MNGGLVVLLALVWAVVLLPGAVRSRRSSPTSSVGTFERAMDVLARRDQPRPRAGGRAIYVPGDAARIVGELTQRRNALIARRRRTFVRLLAVVAMLLPVAVVVGGWTWLLFVAAAAALTVYVGLLLRWKAQAEQAAEVVRRLPDVERAREVAAMQRPVAVGAEADLYPGRDALDHHEPVQRTDDGFPVAKHQDDPWEPQSMVRIRRWDD